MAQIRYQKHEYHIIAQISLGKYDKFTNMTNSTSIINTTSSTSMPQVQPLRSDPTSLTNKVQRIQFQHV